MNLCIDIGNSRVKIGVFKASTLINTHSFSKELLLIELAKLKNNYPIKEAILASVSLIDSNIIEKTHQLFNLTILNINLKFPFKIEYNTPKTLGVDRLALISAAAAIYPNQNVLVIDAGTCITYDFISDKKIYCGGAIAPGIKMRYKSLNLQTDKLPELLPKYPNNITGNSTEQSIHSGVCFGVLYEINGVINQYRSNYRKLTVVLTGGDTNFLSEKLKSGIFANPNFLLTGLNNILNFNLHE